MITLTIIETIKMVSTGILHDRFLYVPVIWKIQAFCYRFQRTLTYDGRFGNSDYAN